MTAILSVPNIKSENARKWKWINRKGKMYTENQYKKTELEILVIVVSENCYIY